MITSVASTTTDGKKPASGLARDLKFAPLWVTFRNIHLIVCLILVFAILQMVILKRVCDTGMTTAHSLENQGLPYLDQIGDLQEHLALFRLHSYECLFAQESERKARRKIVEATAVETYQELHDIKKFLPDSQGRQLAMNLEAAFNDLNHEFGAVQNLEDWDFSAAMKKLDQDIPPKVKAANAAESALEDYGFRISKQQANAAFGSFNWIKRNAIVFGSANVVVSLGAVVFVLLAARRTRSQLSDTANRLEERTNELTGSLSLLNATLDSTADGIVAINAQNKVLCYNQKFVKLWGFSDEMLQRKRMEELITLCMIQTVNPEQFLKQLEKHQTMECFDVIEFRDGRTVECFSKPQWINQQHAGVVLSFRDITERKKAEKELVKAHKQLMDASREAGMAEVATNVLHNVGNVLNSVNVSTTLVLEKIRTSKIQNLGRLAALIHEHQDDLAAFFTTDPKGKQLPDYFKRLAEHLATEQEHLLTETELTRKHIEHIKDIVSMQQSYAKVSRIVEMVKVVDLVEDALRMNAGALVRHEVQVSREYQSHLPEINVEKHKVLQILVNLIRNAKYACDESSRKDKLMTLRVRNGDDRVRIAVIDNGVGIPAENMTRIFNHGFTTRQKGHGFGLHSGALAAKELGGELTAHSEGLDQGAMFILELPLQPPQDL